jgi:hypothetical protein
MEHTRYYSQSVFPVYHPHSCSTKPLHAVQDVTSTRVKVMALAKTSPLTGA